MPPGPLALCRPCLILLALLAKPAFGAVSIQYRPARDVVHPEGELAPLTLEITAAGEYPIALVAAKHQVRTAPPVSFLTPAEGQLRLREDTGAYELRSGEPGHTDTPVGEGVLWPDGRLVFTIQARIPPLTPEQAARGQVELAVQVRYMELVPDSTGQLPVYLPMRETTRGENAMFHAATLESLEATRGYPPLGQRYLVPPHLGSGPGEQVARQEISVAARGGRSGESEQALERSGTPLLYSPRLEGWIVGSADLATLPRLVGAPEEQTIPEGWTLAALLLVEWEPRMPLTLVAMDSATRQLLEPLDIWGPDDDRPETLISHPDIPQLEEVVARCDLRVDADLSPPRQLEISRRP